MATTPIKDVGSVMNLQAAMGNMAANAAGAARNSGDSFQSVLNNQTDAGKAGAAKAQTVKNTDSKAKPGDDLRAKEHIRKDVRTEKPKDEVSEEDLERAAEVVAATADELIAQIADVFDMSVEELQGLMTDMGLQPADLFDPEQLNAFLLQVGGAQDSMALLTNEELYGNYQMLMDQAGEMADAIGEELAVTAQNVMPADADGLSGQPVEAEVPRSKERTEDPDDMRMPGRPDSVAADDTACKGGEPRPRE